MLLEQVQRKVRKSKLQGWVVDSQRNRYGIALWILGRGGPSCPPRFSYGTSRMTRYLVQQQRPAPLERRRMLPVRVQLEQRRRLRLLAQARELHAGLRVLFRCLQKQRKLSVVRKSRSGISAAIFNRILGVPFGGRALFCSSASA